MVFAVVFVFKQKTAYEMRISDWSSDVCSSERGDQYSVGVIQVFIAGGRRIRPQRQLVCGDGAGHAQARIGIDVIGAHQRPGQLVEDGVVLGQQLTGKIETDGVGSVHLYGVSQLGRRDVQGVVSCNVAKCLLFSVDRKST